MLIQSEPKSGEPLLLNVKLPESLHSREQAKTMQVLLLDSQMGTGAAACKSALAWRPDPAMGQASPEPGAQKGR
jgi:uracil phosphoribosyltransferase